MELPFDTADVVKHLPTGETWTVAYTHGTRLAWCGWPEGEALASDCVMVTPATDEQRVKLLHEMAASDPSDARTRYARWRLGRRDSDSRTESL